MNTHALSRHARRRLQQRSIPMSVLDLLEEFASVSRSHGAERLFFDKAARRRLRRELSTDAARFYERHMNVYAVLSDSGTIITVGHRTKRFKRKSGGKN
jgi:hypothetical protein